MASAERRGKTPEFCKKAHYGSYWRYLLFYGGLALFFPMGLYRCQKGDNPYIIVVVLFCGLLGAYRFTKNLIAWWSPLEGDLAKSVSAQLGVSNVQQAFRQIDEDIALHGRKFGPIWVGERWVLGREAMMIREIRGIFVFEVRLKRSEYSLCLVDAADCAQETPFYRKAEIAAAFAHLTALVPSAETGDFEDYLRFLQRDEEARKRQAQAVRGDRRAQSARASD